MIHLKIGKPKGNRKKNREAETGTIEINDDLAAAAALALHFYLNSLREQEKTVSSFQQMMRFYSPWSSKYHNMTPPPNRNFRGR